MGESSNLRKYRVDPMFPVELIAIAFSIPGTVTEVTELSAGILIAELLLSVLQDKVEVILIVCFSSS